MASNLLCSSLLPRSVLILCKAPHLRWLRRWWAGYRIFYRTLWKRNSPSRIPKLRGTLAQIALHMVWEAMRTIWKQWLMGTECNFTTLKIWLKHWVVIRWVKRNQDWFSVLRSASSIANVNSITLHNLTTSRDNSLCNLKDVIMMNYLRWWQTNCEPLSHFSSVKPTINWKMLIQHRDITVNNYSNNLRTSFSAVLIIALSLSHRVKKTTMEEPCSMELAVFS